jgi:hypothetical protein
MQYSILPVSNLFFVQHFRKGEWLFVRITKSVEGSPVPYPGVRGFRTSLDAYSWIVLNKLHGNYALALLRIEEKGTSHG